MKILITGATGLVGKEVGKALVKLGHEIVIISRNAVKAKQVCPFPCEVIEGDLVQAPVSSHHLDQVEAVVHLMGEPIVEGRWTEEKKKRLQNSRIQATRHLQSSLAGRAKILVSTSAVGYYGDRGDESLTEDSAPGNGFLSNLCRDWEDAAKAFSKEGTRVVCLRVGVVLSNRGGALDEMLTPVRAGVGGPLGGGKQWVSWIHLGDLVKLYLAALHDDRMSGVYNAVAPAPVQNRDLMKALGKLVRRPTFLPVPGFGLKVLFGEKAQVLLDSQNVSSQKVEQTGFQFDYPDLEIALTDLLPHLTRGEDLFVAEQYVDLPKEKLFPFFSRAENLGTITPKFLDFKILNVSDPQVQEGTLIDYRMKIHGVPIRWKTRIEEWTPPKKFVDTQLKGPYQTWHHTHLFEDLGKGTLIIDWVRYRLPMAYPGWLVAGAFVRGDVETIFQYRREVIDQMIAQGEIAKLK